MATKKSLNKGSIKSPKKTIAKPKSDFALGGLLAPIIIAVIIAGIASGAGLIVKKVRESAKAKVPLTVTAESPAGQNFITIKDKDSDKTYQVEIKPASAAEVSARPTPASPADQKALAQGTPVKTDYSYLLKERVSGTAGIRHIDIDEAKFLYDSGKAVFVDTRSRGEYEQGHIKGAVFLPVGFSPEDYERLKSRLQDKVLVTYCHGVGCHLSDKVAARLVELKHDRVDVFFGGWPKWNEHKYPTASNPVPTPTPIK
jgi:rhodanese-related sulfurtransferase